MEGKEIWLSEFGYDSDNLNVGDTFVDDMGVTQMAVGGIQIPDDLVNVNDPDGPKLNKELVQAQWLSRSYLELMAVDATIPSLGGTTKKGVDRFMQYEIADAPIKPDDAPGRQQFQSTGLLEKTGEQKISHFYTQTLLHHLGNYQMDKEGAAAPNDGQFPATRGGAISIPSQGVPVPTASIDHPVAYKFALGTGSSAPEMFAIWSPTESGYDYEVDVDLSDLFQSSDVPTEFTVVRLQDLAPRGVVESYEVNDGVVRLRVTEEPLLLRAGSPGINTNVAPPSFLGGEDLCCGDVRFTIGRNRRSLTSSFAIGYAPQSAASGGYIPLSDITIVESSFIGSTVVIPGLDDKCTVLFGSDSTQCIGLWLPTNSRSTCGFRI